MCSFLAIELEFSAIFWKEFGDCTCLSRVGKCSYISCSDMFVYYIRKFFVEAKMFLYFLILFSLIILLQGCKPPLFENHL